MVKEGDTIVIHEDFEEFVAGDKLIVDRVDSDGVVWVKAENDQVGFDPFEYRTVKRDTPDDTVGADVETFQRNQTNDNLRSIFG